DPRHPPRGPPVAGEVLRPPARRAWRSRPPGDPVPSERGRGTPQRRRRAPHGRLLSPPRVRAAEDDPAGARLEPPLCRDVSDHAPGPWPHLRPRRPPARDAGGPYRRRIDLSVDPAEGPHLQPDGQRGPGRDEARGAPRMIVAITGASGSLGGRLCDHLV